MRVEPRLALYSVVADGVRNFLSENKRINFDLIGNLGCCGRNSLRLHADISAHTVTIFKVFLATFEEENEVDTKADSSK